MVLCPREWGRIGRPGQMHSVPYPTEQEAHAALARQRRVKERRGYFDRSAAHVISLQIIRRERVDVESLIFRVDGRQRIERDNPALY
jgi:predicted DNA-binding WGR domain protein